MIRKLDIVACTDSAASHLFVESDDEWDTATKDTSGFAFAVVCKERIVFSATLEAGQRTCSNRDHESLTYKDSHSVAKRLLSMDYH